MPSRLFERINGSGWIIGIIVNTLAIAALYWGLVRRMDKFEERQSVQIVSQLEMKNQLATAMATKEEVNALWECGQEQHKRIWDAIGRAEVAQRKTMDQSWIKH
jgi:hypothetical protein